MVVEQNVCSQKISLLDSKLDKTKTFEAKESKEINRSKNTCIDMDCLGSQLKVRTSSMDPNSNHYFFYISFKRFIFLLI